MFMLIPLELMSVVLLDKLQWHLGIGTGRLTKSKLMITQWELHHKVQVIEKQADAYSNWATYSIRPGTYYKTVLASEYLTKYCASIVLKTNDQATYTNVLLSAVWEMSSES